MICPDRCTMQLIGTYQGIKINEVYRCKWCTVTSYRSVGMDKEQLIAEMAVENAELREQLTDLRHEYAQVNRIQMQMAADIAAIAELCGEPEDESSAIVGLVRDTLAAKDAELERVRQLPAQWRRDYAEAAVMEGEYPVHHHYGRRHADELEAALAGPESLVECNQCHERLTMDEFKRRGADDCDEGCSIVRDALASPAAEPAQNPPLTFAYRNWKEEGSLK